MYRTDFWTLWEKARVGCFKRTASKHIYYLGWNRSPAQVGCMRQVLRPGALGTPRGIGWRVRWEGGPGWGIHVNPWLIHFNVWQKPLQCCKVISLQLINEKKKKESEVAQSCPTLCDPMDCSPTGFSVQGIFQSRILEWVATSFFRGTSWPRDWTWVSHTAGKLTYRKHLTVSVSYHYICTVLLHNLWSIPNILYNSHNNLVLLSLF